MKEGGNGQQWAVYSRRQQEGEWDRSEAPHWGHAFSPQYLAFAATAPFHSQLDPQLFTLNGRYLTGDKPTAMDLRLFMTLIRFDAVYFVYFKTNKKKIREYPNLFEYCKDMYQLPEMARAINMDHIKMHYFTSHPSLNMYGIIPKGPDVDYLQPHNRA